MATARAWAREAGGVSVAEKTAAAQASAMAL
ncbi:hypothetical protein JOF35_005132 [Streptomyces demainii]|uniref:Uncharacterized protein n=1 Tax=Streptomyces demainii TaxID=588122 RepID=A0ABT9KWR1_9ACTN|nr:hypothetical protein [Streptomyces demainii]